MRLKPISLSFALLLCSILLLPSCSTPPGIRVSAVHYPFLKHTTAKKGMRWYWHEGFDFDVFYGRLPGSKSGGVGFYRGGFPNFHPDDKANIFRGKLGIFPIEWHESFRNQSPRFYRSGMVPYKTKVTKVRGRESRYTEIVHIWIYGDSEAEVQQLTDYVSGLDLFARKLEDEVREIK